MAKPAFHGHIYTSLLLLVGRYDCSSRLHSLHFSWWSLFFHLSAVLMTPILKFSPISPLLSPSECRNKARRNELPGFASPPVKKEQNCLPGWDTFLAGGVPVSASGAFLRSPLRWTRPSSPLQEGFLLCWRSSDSAWKKEPPATDNAFQPSHCPGFSPGTYL